MQKEIEKIFVDIIKHELNLPDNYGKTSKGDIIPTVIIAAQNIKLFNTNKLQITVKTVSSRNYSNRSEVKENPNNPDEFLEIQDLNQSRLMQIDIYSRNNDARVRYPEVVMALNSNYAKQQMDLYNFKIGTITNDINLSGLDGGSDINRFTISFNVLVHYQKITPIPYYDKFQTNLDGEQGQIAQINRSVSE